MTFFTRFRLFFLFSIMAMGTALFGSGPSVATGHPVFLLSIDGLMPDHIFQAEKYQLQLPNLKKLVREGTSATGVKGVIPTLTYPSHATLLTGVNPARHGIHNNGVFDPFAQHAGAWFWYAYELAVPTLWEKAKAHGLITASVDWPVSVGAGAKGVDHLIVQYWRDSTPLDLHLIRALSTPGLLEETMPILGPYPNADWNVTGDRIRGEYLVYLLNKKRPDFLTGYLSSVDENSHRYGPFSQQTFAALEEVDKILGKILEIASARQANVVVVSDHGFLPIQTEIRINAAFKEKGLLTVDEKGKITSFSAYAWEAQGTAAIVLKNPNDEDLKEKVRDVIKEMSEGYPVAIETLWTEKELKVAGAFPQASFLAVAGKGYTFSSSVEFPVIGAKPKYAATHGYLSERTEMDAVWLMRGPSIPEGKSLGRVQMIDVAPTVADLLGVELEGAEGRNQLASPSPKRD